MKIKPVFCFFCTVFFLLNSYGQKERNEPIVWSAEKLTWKDYRAESAGKRKKDAASTASGITYTWSYVASVDTFKLDFDVKSEFYPARSWVKPDQKTARLLAHEQLHFDISELHARKLLKAFEEYVPMRNIRADLQRIFAKIQSASKKMQVRYDRETNHGLDPAEQKRWNEKIRKNLERLEGE